MKERRSEIVKFINSWKNVVRAALVCLMLGNLVLLGSRISVAQTYYFTLEATITDDPGWGYYGGYHAIWDAIIPELEKINISLYKEQNSMYDWWYKVWQDGWNYPGDTGPPTYGWDLTMLEWWLQPHAVEPWFCSMILHNQTPDQGGFNIHPWNNSRADNLVLTGIQSYDPGTRRDYLWAWQQEWMHDPPQAVIYYPRIYEASAPYVMGYEPSSIWWYDAKHLDVNVTEFELVVGEGGYNENLARYAAGNDTIFYAVSEDVWTWNPMYMDSYTEENFEVLVYDTLYTWSLNYATHDEWLAKAGRVEPNLDDYIIVPELAADYPTILDGGLRMRVPLREDVLWSDGEPMNATDVKFTYDLTFNPDAACTGTGDFAYAIESVEVVPDPGGSWCAYTEQFIDPYLVDFILRFPHPDFISVVSNDWGGGSIIPWHVLHDTAPADIANHAATKFWHSMLPGTGPFTVTHHQQNQYIKLERNPLHWGYGLGYGPYVSTIYLEFIPDAGTRLTELQINNIDMGEYPTASVDDYEVMKTWDNLHVYEYNYPSSNGVWFNFNNEYLSNRYVRLAIAHAIPYQYIYDNILPSWGITQAYPGKTYILPAHYYGGEHLFNDDLLPYTYNIQWAEDYLMMWVYSKPEYAPPGSPQVNLGPVGDADFSGRVNYDDYWVWRKNTGKTPADPDWPKIPGNDIDPDFDNDGAVLYPQDFVIWGTNYGKRYPTTIADPR
jgi:ABC-type transport system substrate-binding protein